MENWQTRGVRDPVNVANADESGGTLMRCLKQVDVLFAYEMLEEFSSLDFEIM